MINTTQRQRSLFPELDNREKILNHLRRLPHLQLSETGMHILCKIWGLSVGELEEFIGQVVAEGGPR